MWGPHWENNSEVTTKNTHEKLSPSQQTSFSYATINLFKQKWIVLQAGRSGVLFFFA